MPNNRVLISLLFTVGALFIGAAGVFEIYNTPQVFVIAVAALLLVCVPLWLRDRFSISKISTALVAAGMFVVFLVPVALPGMLRSALLREGPGAVLWGILQAYLTGVAGVVTGWKQLLTLSLPVGDYQAVLVPWLLLTYAVAWFGLLAGRAGQRWQLPVAFVPFLPLVFATVFGSQQPKSIISLAGFGISKVMVLWVLAAVLGGVWIWWHTTAARRAALRLGRSSAEKQRSQTVRTAAGTLFLVLAVGSGLVFAPGLTQGGRQVAREAVDPAVVLARVPSLLAEYRAAKTDDLISAPLFSVEWQADAVPARLPLAVLPDYNGTEFGIAAAGAKRFVRLTAGQQLRKPAEVTFTIQKAYRGVWLPGGSFGDVPEFAGKRVAELAEEVFTNPGLGTSIIAGSEQSGATTETGFAAAAVTGLLPGDSYTVAVESATPALSKLGSPVQDREDFSRTMPQLAKWLQRQQIPPTAAGLTEAIKTLRERGYLSHSLERDAGSGKWYQQLREKFGSSFAASPGGHSRARLEDMFRQLNEQEQAAGLRPNAKQLVAAVGDDEQFAAASALIARSLGFSSRVVVGVRFNEGVDGVPACEKVCRGDNLAAWIEVRGSGEEWVAFDVTPQVRNAPQQISAGEQHPKYVTVPQEQDAKVVEPPQGAGEQGRAARKSVAGQGASWVWPLLLLLAQVVLLLILLALPFVWLVVLRVQRTVFRGGGFASAEMQQVLLWERLVAGLRDAGRELPANCTRQELAAALGDERIIEVARLVDGAVFSGGASAAATQRISDLVAAVLRDERGRLRGWKRIAAVLGWRTFWDSRPRMRRIVADAVAAIRRLFKPLMVGLKRGKPRK